ncbi:MAG: hypothetical protein AB1589_39400 [Cyanobacteriota bacterium]
MDNDYPDRSERYTESYPDTYRDRTPRSEVDMLVERLDRLIVAMEKQQESHDRLMSMLERQMTVIERLLLR